LSIWLLLVVARQVVEIQVLAVAAVVVVQVVQPSVL
jgi:hypothetical protein